MHIRFSIFYYSFAQNEHCRYVSIKYFKKRVITYVIGFKSNDMMMTENKIEL